MKLLTIFLSLCFIASFAYSDNPVTQLEDTIKSFKSTLAAEFRTRQSMMKERKLLLVVNERIIADIATRRGVSQDFLRESMSKLQSYAKLEADSNAVILGETDNLQAKKRALMRSLQEKGIEERDFIKLNKAIANLGKIERLTATIDHIKAKSVGEFKKLKELRQKLKRWKAGEIDFADSGKKKMSNTKKAAVVVVGVAVVGASRWAYNKLSKKENKEKQQEKEDTRGSNRLIYQINAELEQTDGGAAASR